MAKYTIEHKCGHEREVNIVGPEKERPRKREWLASQVCPDCKREQTRLAVEAWTEARGLVELAGSEKQIAWALKIRKELLEEMDKYVYPMDESEEMSYIIRAHKWASKQSQAKWWIDRRDKTGKSLLREMVARLKASDAQKEVPHAKE